MRATFLPDFTASLTAFYRGAADNASSRRPAIQEGPRRKEPQMKTTQHLWMKRLATVAAVIALPLAVMAHGPAGDALESCPPMPHPGGPMALPPPGMFPEAPLVALPMAPYLRGLELTEAQQDKLFSLMHEQAPNERQQSMAALKALEELRRLAVSDRFDADKARVLAEAHAQAMAKVTLMHAEIDAKVRALLTPGQRKQLDDARSRGESRLNFKRTS
jgi:Spy/CpxP family protein refolding chaperone